MENVRKINKYIWIGLNRTHLQGKELLTNTAAVLLRKNFKTMILYSFIISFLIVKRCRGNKLVPTLNSIPFTPAVQCAPPSNTQSLAHFLFSQAALFSLRCCGEFDSRDWGNHISSAAWIQWAAPGHTSSLCPLQISRFRFLASLFLSGSLWLWPLNSSPLCACEVANLGRFPQECLWRSLWRNGIKLLCLSTTTNPQVCSNTDPY